MFRPHCAILRKNSYHFSKQSAYCNFVTVAELQSMKYMVSGFVPELFKFSKTILARCYGLKVFFLNIKNLCLKNVNVC